LRVPALARYPGHIKPGSVLGQPCWSPDLLIAAVKLAGAKMPADRTYDGKNPLRILTDNESSPHHSFYFEYRTHAALRRHQWKIVREQPDQAWKLFDLSRDISESQNLAAQQSVIVGKLAGEFQWKKTKLESE